MKKELYMSLIQAAEHHYEALADIADNLEQEPIGDVSPLTFMDMDSALVKFYDGLQRVKRYAKAKNRRASRLRCDPAPAAER